jgi:hypothetical protein
MNRKPFLKSLSEGRGNCPLPSRTHPQKQTRVVYTEELTHLVRGYPSTLPESRCLWVTVLTARVPAD